MIAYNDVGNNNFIELGGKSTSMYAVCTTDAALPVKTAHIDNLGHLQPGATIRIKFTEENTATNPRLKVNDMQEIPMYSKGGMRLTSWDAGIVMQFTFDGESWFISGGGGSGAGMPSDPLTVDHGGTGNSEGYIQTGQLGDYNVGSKATAEGMDNNASGAYSHAEGLETAAIGEASHTEGNGTAAEGVNSHAEGLFTYATGDYSHAEGASIEGSMDFPWVEAQGAASHAEGQNTLAYGDASHSEGHFTKASGNYSHTEGTRTEATETAAHAEGYMTIASGLQAHAEGSRNTASGPQSHAGGRQNIAAYPQQTVIGRYNYNREDTLFEVGNGDEAFRSNAMEVYRTGEVKIYGPVSDENGRLNAVEANPPGDATASLSKLRVGDTLYTVSGGGGGGLPSDPLTVDHGGTGNSVGYIQTGRKSGSAIGTHATAEGTNTIASGVDAHAEGTETIASGDHCHSAGYHTIAGGDSQTVVGRFNDNQANTLFEVGNGHGDDDRSNALEVRGTGDLIVHGSIYNDDGIISAVEANPQGSATQTLLRLRAGSTIYDIPSGGGGGAHQKVFSGKSSSSGTRVPIDTNIDLGRPLEEGDVILVDLSDIVYETATLIVYNNGVAISTNIDGGIIIPESFYTDFCSFEFNGTDFDCSFKNVGHDDNPITAGTGIEITESNVINNSLPMRGFSVRPQTKADAITTGALGSLFIKDTNSQFVDIILLTFVQGASTGTSGNYRYTASTGSTMLMGNLYQLDEETLYTEEIPAGSTLMLDVSAKSKAIVLAVFGSGSGGGDVPIATTTVAGKVKPDGTSITVDADGTIHAVGGPSVTYLDDVTGASSSISGNSVTLIWTDPDDIQATRSAANGEAIWAGTKVIRKEDVAPETIDDGVVVVDSTVRNQYSATGYTDSNLDYGKTYYYRFFPYTTEGVVTVGTSLSVSLGKEQIASLPQPSTTLTYDGSQQTMTFVDFDSSKLTVSGNTGTNAGNYTATFTPKSNYEWWDGTTAGKTVAWTIGKKSVVIPTVSGSYSYDGNQHSATISSFSASEITQTGTATASEVGTYTVYFDLTSTTNYEWTDGTASQKSGTWSIQNQTITIPTVSGSYTYDGTTKTASITGLDSSVVNQTGTASSSTAGTYTVYFNLKDPTNSKWSDGTNTQKSGTWTIARKSVSVPSVSGSYTYDGTTKYASIGSYSTSEITQGGTTSATNAGTYNVTFDLKDTTNYQWVGGSTSQQSASWTISRSAGSITLSKSSIKFDPDHYTDTVTFSGATGTVSVSSTSGSWGTITGSVSGSTITFTYSGSLSASTTKPVNILVAQSTNYNSTSTSVTASLNFAPKVYGVSWDGTSTATLSRTDSAASFVDPTPAVGTSGTGSSPFDSILPWSGMTVETVNGNTMVKIPKFYYSLSTSSSGSFTLKITDKQATGYYVSPAHMDRGDGKGERDYVYVAKYLTTTANRSVPSGSIQYSKKRSDFRSTVPGTGFYQWDFLTAWTIRMLYLVEFASWAFEAKIGRCATTKSTTTGATASMSYHTGTTGSSKTAATGITQYRNIEMLAGGGFTFIDGIVGRGSTSSGSIYLYTNPANFSDTYNGTGVATLGSCPVNTGWIKAYTAVSSVGSRPLPRISSIDSGSSGSYTTDKFEVSFTSDSITYVVYTGGCIANGGTYVADYGLFYQNMKMKSTETSALVGSRLMYLP